MWRSQNIRNTGEKLQNKTLHGKKKVKYCYTVKAK